MARYIDADALIPMMKYATTDNEVGIFPIRIGFNDIVKVINDMSAADVRENVRGEWIHKYTHESLHDRTGIWCSACGRDALQDSEGYYIEDCETDFCPHCGADMRGEKNE